MRGGERGREGGRGGFRPTTTEGVGERLCLLFPREPRVFVTVVAVATEGVCLDGNMEEGRSAIDLTS